MAYRDGSEPPVLLKRTLKGVADFQGRSQRTEVGNYWFACFVLAFLLILPVSLILPYPETELFIRVFQWIVAIPMVALFVRGLHDQNKTGWWALLLVALVIVDAMMFASNLSVPGRPPNAGLFSVGPIRWIYDSLILAVIVLFLWPGTEGTNRYGGDPRL